MTIPLDILAKLARLAPKVEPEIDNSKDKRNTVAAKNVTLQFVTEVGLKPGKNEVPINDIILAVEEWHDGNVSELAIKKVLNEKFKTSNGNVKLNMKTITILEKVKELKLVTQK